MSRALQLAASRVSAATPTFVNRLVAGRPIEIDGQTLHPDAQAFLRLERLFGLDRIGDGTAAEREGAVRSARLTRGRTIPVGRVEEVTVAGAAGPLPARHYVPLDAPPAGPLLLWFHGGGFAVGGFETHDQLCRLLCVEAETRVLVPLYRHGPEHRFPAAHDDALAAYLDVAGDPGRFGAAAGRIAVGGDSAGGNLATWVARATREGAAPPPRFQALVYPVCDRTRERRSHELFGRGFYLTRERIAAWHDAYHSAAEATDPRLSPLLTEDLSGMAPAELLVAGFDPLRDECLEYAARLREAGNEVHVDFAADVFHGFVNAVGVSAHFREIVRRLCRRMCARS